MPADVMRQVRIAMAQNADLSLGASGTVSGRLRATPVTG